MFFGMCIWYEEVPHTEVTKQSSSGHALLLLDVRSADAVYLELCLVAAIKCSLILGLPYCTVFLCCFCCSCCLLHNPPADCFYTLQCSNSTFINQMC